MIRSVPDGRGDGVIVAGVHASAISEGEHRQSDAARCVWGPTLSHEITDIDLEQRSGGRA